MPLNQQSPKVFQPPKPNLTKTQNSALREIKRGRDHIVLTADKGVVMVIMDRQDYINKANSLLNQNTYRSIHRDPTNTIKNKLISILKRIKNQTGLDSNTYKSMYPTHGVPPKFYGLPKIHKPDTPLKPIVSSCGSVTYGVVKELAKILKPLVGKTPHHINSTQDFVEQVKHITLAPGECLSSYDVSALFTSVPVDSALNIKKDLLEKDHTLKERTVLAVSDIILLLEFCLKNTWPVLWTGWWCSHGFPSQSHYSQPLHGVLRTKSSKHCSKPPQVLAQICGWYLCHPQGSQHTRLLSTHQQVWPCYKVYSGGQQGGWIHPLLGHHCQTWGWWHTIYHCVQETYTYRPVFAVG